MKRWTERLFLDGSERKNATKRISEREREMGGERSLEHELSPEPGSGRHFVSSFVVHFKVRKKKKCNALSLLVKFWMITSYTEILVRALYYACDRLRFLALFENQFLTLSQVLSIPFPLHHFTFPFPFFFSPGTCLLSLQVTKTQNYISLLMIRRRERNPELN